MNDYDVCIVGLGPTGLTLAHLLATRGVSVLVLEREPAFYGMARAVYTDDECLRIMQNAGVADDLHAQMITDLPVQWVRRDGTVLAQFRTPGRPLGWPVSNFLYQPDFEQTLERRLAEHGNVTVLRGREVTSFEQDPDGVTVRHVASSGGWGTVATTRAEESPEEVRASYLVGADGGRSVVRTQLGIQMEGRSFPQRWLVIDLEAVPDTEPFRHLPYFDFVCDPELPTVSCPQPGNRHRFEFMLHDDDRTEDFETDEVARRLMGEFVDVDKVVVRRQLVYTFNALIAEEWRRGRVLLAGDAAHMTPQFIGQGMNSGLRDADNLSWKLAAVVRHGASETILDSYESERRPHARAMINLSVFNKDVVSTGHPAAIRARDWGLSVSQRIPGLRTSISEAKIKPKPRFAKGSYLGLPRRMRGAEGTLMPQPPMRTVSGRPARLDDEIGTGWALIGVGVDPTTVLTDPVWATLEATWSTVHAVGRRLPGHPNPKVTEVEANDDAWSDWLRTRRIRTGDVLVVRPDKYVFAVASATTQAQAADAVRRQLGLRDSVRVTA